MQTLLDKGANVDAKYIHGKTLLHNAVESIKTKIAARTCRCIAANTWYLQIVQHLLKYIAYVHCVCASTFGDGCTPLHLAVENEHEAIVKLLLECGGYVDAKDKNNKTVLHLAVEQGSSIIVEHILKRRPDLNKKSNSSVLNIAVQGCGMEYRKIVKNLLEYGFTINPKDANNFMHAAVEKRYVELVEELLKHSTDDNMSSDSTFVKDSILLHVAIKNRHEEVAKLLIRYGADVNAPDETGKTPIFHATENADLKMIKLLLTNEANVNDPVLLNIAVITDCREIVEVILQHGTDVDGNDECARIPLHVVVLKNEACRSHDHEVPDNVITEISKMLSCEGVKHSIVKNDIILLDANIDNIYMRLVQVHMQNKREVIKFKWKRSITPLHISVLLSNKEITEMLLTKGANVNA